MPPLHLVIVAAVAADLGPWQAQSFPATLSLVVNEKARPLAAIGNEYLSQTPAEVLGICHADTSFGPGALEAFTRAAHCGVVAGMVGRDLDRVYRWSRDNPGPVSTLDSCSVFLRPDLGLRFDEQTFNGFHCHVEDLCLQARECGIPVLVPAAQAWHGEKSTRLRPWQLDYLAYRRKLNAKWAGVSFRTT